MLLLYRHREAQRIPQRRVKIMEIKKTLAEKAVTLPIFAAFRFCFVNYANLKVLQSGNLRVGFCDGSHFIMTKNGDMFLMFLVCSVKHAPLLPSVWILAKNSCEAIAEYKKDVKTSFELKACLPF